MKCLFSTTQKRQIVVSSNIWFRRHNKLFDKNQRNGIAILFFILNKFCFCFLLINYYTNKVTQHEAVNIYKRVKLLKYLLNGRIGSNLVVRSKYKWQFL